MWLHVACHRVGAQALEEGDSAAAAQRAGADQAAQEIRGQLVAVEEERAVAAEAAEVRHLAYRRFPNETGSLR